MVGLDRGTNEKAGEGDDGQAQTAGQVLVCEGVGVVVFCENVEEAAIDCWLCVVEFRDVGMFDPID